MASVPHDPLVPARESSRWGMRLFVPEMWASLAIVAMWLTVLLVAIWGPDFVSTTGTPPGASETTTTIPSAWPIALFAFLGTWIVARHGFGRRERD